MKKMSLILASSLLFAQVSFANSLSDNLLTCAYQFELLTSDEFGEGTGIIELDVEETPEGNIRYFKVVQDNEVRGYMSVDIQGDITQIDDSGNLLKVCQ
ncbi:hypothetical protein GW916_11935 [bacterium]|nr:hypothetical protein [bacterium]